MSWGQRGGGGLALVFPGICTELGPGDVLQICSALLLGLCNTPTELGEQGHHWGSQVE